MDGKTFDLDALRAGLAGADHVIATPFGERPLVYADYTASGRAFSPIEARIAERTALLANPHTEDSATGRASNAWAREAEDEIRRAVNAGPEHALIACGDGATGAIHRLQQILGVAIPPAARERMLDAAEAAFGADGREKMHARMTADAPVVFTGPYEHHSNELTWREGLCETVAVRLCPEGGLDFDHLESLLTDPAHEGRMKIGAFSAASNVTGVKTDIVRLARLLHRHGAMLCLDAAASAPYARIDMRPEGEPDAHPDAVYFSPHKFVGGPGSSGILLFNKSLYRDDLAPTISGGGTVRYVWSGGHDFIAEVEARERAGTPGLPQLMRAAEAMKLQRKVGFDTIERREQAALERAFDRWTEVGGVEILGPTDPTRRLGIVSFTIRDPRGGWLHPRFVTTLLSDLFGVQARAGCACAGPYAHALLGIGEDETRAYRQAVLDGQPGHRPGWSRVSLHWSFSDTEIDYLIETIAFIAQEGWRFLPLYRFEAGTGAWRWMGEDRVDPRAAGRRAGGWSRTDLYAASLDAARMLAAQQYECGHRTCDLPQGVAPERAFTLPA